MERSSIPPIPEDRRQRLHPIKSSRDGLKQCNSWWKGKSILFVYNLRLIIVKSTSLEEYTILAHRFRYLSKLHNFPKQTESSDKWELYIPSELAYGARGSPPKIPADSALVFTIEMINIQGEKVMALKCNSRTLEDCDDRMKTYIEKANKKYGADADELDEEISRLRKMSSDGSMKPELRDWIDMRVYILQQMLMAANSKEEL
mmetsp:Transcript_24295/g.48650  ORF Transcript_24295/g.48650 Transcript_24295/m.48650 type:complete len:203 (+) Transcript_24295:90-698(+)